MYDAVRGGPVVELVKKDGKLAGHFRFGPGEMRVFARTARPIGKVAGLTPVVVCDYTKAEQPTVVEVPAYCWMPRAARFCGSVPMQVRLIDPLGNVRYDLYRATDRERSRSVCRWAANDPSGQWKVSLPRIAQQQGKHAGVPLCRAAAVRCDGGRHAAGRALWQRPRQCFPLPA